MKEKVTERKTIEFDTAKKIFTFNIQIECFER